MVPAHIEPNVVVTGSHTFVAGVVTHLLQVVSNAHWLGSQLHTNEETSSSHVLTAFSCLHQ